ncbi:MAG TPA: flagellar biosynthetic protein FliQ [Stenotrophomonas sp.]
MTELTAFAAEAFLTVYRISMPIVLVAVLAGIAIAILQTLFQIQDQSLPYAIKLVAVGLALVIAAPATSREIRQLLHAVAAQLGGVA